MAEKTTKSFILRVDADTMNAIEAWAADEFRSTNGQLQWIITEALRKAKRLPKKKKGSNHEETEIKVERSTEGNIFELAFVLLTIVVWVAIVMLYHQALDMMRGHVLFVLIMIVVMVLVCPVFIYFIYREG